MQFAEVSLTGLLAVIFDWMFLRERSWDGRIRCCVPVWGSRCFDVGGHIGSRLHNSPRPRSGQNHWSTHPSKDTCPIWRFLWFDYSLHSSVLALEDCQGPAHRTVYFAFRGGNVHSNDLTAPSGPQLLSVSYINTWLRSRGPHR